MIASHSFSPKKEKEHGIDGRNTLLFSLSPVEEKKGGTSTASPSLSLFCISHTPFLSLGFIGPASALYTTRETSD